MADVKELTDRIDAELGTAQRQVAEFQQQQTADYQARQDRLVQFEKLLDELKEVWRPRLQVLADRFGDRMSVTPKVEPARREAVFKMQSPLARITLRIGVAPDLDVRKIQLTYDLEVLPIYMEFDKHSQIAFPLDAVDREALTRWLDDRLVTFVRTYLEIHQNQYYLKEHLVEDPIAHVKFPKHAAGATLEVQGKTLYFIGEETKNEYRQKHGQ